MNSELREEFNKQLGDIIADYRALVSKSEYDDASDAPPYDIQALLARSYSAVEKIAGTSSSYVRQLNDINSRNDRDIFRLSPTIGVLMALKSELESGYLTSLQQVIRGNMFSDYLEMADHLLQEGYKDPAAVIAGSSLEIHLRNLAKIHNVAFDILKDGKLIPKKADRLNADLVKAGVYARLDQKNVTAWMALRNDAAHGKYDRYSPEQVSIMISGIRDFMIRNPA